MSYQEDFEYGQKEIDKQESSGLLRDIFGTNITQIAPHTKQQVELDIDYHYTNYGKIVLVEQKTVRNIHEAIFLEVVSCSATNSPGWAWKTKADQILYYMNGQNGAAIAYLLERKTLKKWMKEKEANLINGKWRDNSGEFPYTRHTNEYTTNKSQGYIIPWCDLDFCTLARYEIQNYKIVKQEIK